MTVLPFPSRSARDEDPETSHEAAQSSDSDEIIETTLLREYAAADLDYGLTDSEAMDAAGYDIALDGHRRRCSTLREQGYIEPLYINARLVKRRSRYSGRARMACIITESGADRLDFVDGV